MFDQEKCVQGWTTMACHIYNPVYYKVMTIAVCDIESKNMEIRCILRRKLTTFTDKKRLGTLVFKGFMADGA
jgi:hypothetical protein